MAATAGGRSTHPVTMVKAASAADLEAGKMKAVKLTVPGKDGEHEILLTKTTTGKIFATASKCTHFGLPLAGGVVSGDRIVCPFHGACFHAETGDIEDGPGRDRLRTYPVEVRDGEVHVGLPEAPVGFKVPPVVSARGGEAGAVVGEGKKLVIVGGGAAALSAVETLRSEGYAGSITMISKADRLPYDLTLISKGLKDPPPLRDETWFREAGVDVVLGDEVVAVTADSVNTASGKSFGYDDVLCATSGPPRAFREGEPITIPGADASNVFTVRSGSDAVDILGALETPGSGPDGKVQVVTLGASFIGLESAAALMDQKGVGADSPLSSISLIDGADTPLAHVLGPHVGKLLQKEVENMGCRFHLGSHAKSITVSEDGRATEVVLSNGDVVPADVVLVGAGILPSTGYLSGTPGVAFPERGGGVTVDAYLRAAPHVYVAGDIASYPFQLPGAKGPVHTRIEHWDVATDQGRTAARNIMGRDRPYRVAPFFWSKIGPLNIRYTGHFMGDAKDKASVIVRGDADADAPAITAFYAEGDAITAVFTLRTDPNAVAAKHLLEMGAMPSASDIRRDAPAPIRLADTLAKATATKSKM